MKNYTQSFTEDGKTSNGVPHPIGKCDICGWEEPETKNNRRGMVTYMVCRDASGRALTQHGGRFIKRDREGCYQRNKEGNYILQDGWTFVAWVEWCTNCHADRQLKAEPQKKTNRIDYGNMSYSQAKAFLDGALGRLTDKT
jgi:hypothetical protein